MLLLAAAAVCALTPLKATKATKTMLLPAAAMAELRTGPGIRAVAAGVDGFGGGAAALALSFLSVPVVLGFTLWPESTCGFFCCACK
ncbi:hypothetical protein T492DRAFT_896270 [Pavlovales sp. CCMP2436]|nr:hypothetical protein T492DRAFT_896270 [Pavlovales sp. CCMP2436]